MDKIHAIDYKFNNLNSGDIKGVIYYDVDTKEGKKRISIFLWSGNIQDTLSGEYNNYLFVILEGIGHENMAIKFKKNKQVKAGDNIIREIFEPIEKEINSFVVNGNFKNLIKEEDNIFYLLK